MLTCQFGYILEHLVGLDAFVLADLYWRGVCKEYALIKATGLHRKDRWQHIGPDQLGEPVIGDRRGELVLLMVVDIVKIKMFEGSVIAHMEKQGYGQYLAPGHLKGPRPILFPVGNELLLKDRTKT